MDNGETYLTRDGYEKLKKKLDHLKNKRRRELSKAIAEARAHGDISENAEYDAAKDAQALNEGRIATLESKLARTRIIDDEDIPKDQIFIGAKVDLLDLETEEEIHYILVSELEADYEQNKISITSPVGKALLGHKQGETVEIQAPAGLLQYKILKISR
ncbi:MAG: transcription elongation factor GreA [Candidatus Omnitrophica bacterium]|nr:transcription elongation factor GreA [Candidatus Omnitrophota bacterium]